MFRPSQEEVEELATQGNMIPVVREILADLDTPLSLFLRLDDGRTSFLLESAEGGENWARYSFIGTGSRAIFRARGDTVEWIEGEKTERLVYSGDPLEVLLDRLAALHTPNLDGFDFPPFLGGAVGMVAYDWVRQVEDLPDDNPDPIGLPDLWFSLPETIVVYDNLRKSALVVRHVAAGPDVCRHEKLSGSPSASLLAAPDNDRRAPSSPV